MLILPDNCKRSIAIQQAMISCHLHFFFPSPSLRSAHLNTGEWQRVMQLVFSVYNSQPHTHVTVPTSDDIKDIRTWWKTSLLILYVTLSTRNFTLPDTVANLGLRGNRPVNRHSHGTAFLPVSQNAFCDVRCIAYHFTAEHFKFRGEGERCTVAIAPWNNKPNNSHDIDRIQMFV